MALKGQYFKISAQKNQCFNATHIKGEKEISFFFLFFQCDLGELAL